VQPVSVFWFRRDLRLQDNAGLYHALKNEVCVLPIFIFDTNILDDLENKEDRRVSFIHDSLIALQNKLQNLGSSLCVLRGKPLHCFNILLKTYAITSVYTNHDYEPYAIQRDREVADLLKANNIPFHNYKDQVIFEKDEVTKENSEPYNVYTPYSKRWKNKLSEYYLRSYPAEKYFASFYKTDALPFPSIAEIGFKKTNYSIPGTQLDLGIALKYDATRDYPAVKGTTRLGVHLRFGTISIRELARQVSQINGTLLNELIWREFFQMILWHFPRVVHQSFKKEYDKIKWRNNEDEFKLWCKGQTGYAVVDAGMRELNETGYMHNRVRMIAASFLCKHLLIDWRWGEAYFAEKLMDYELASNNGNWQWAAGTGCDAAPYFRIFNPYTQTEKFDPQHVYIKKWVPESDTPAYAKPIVNHEEARLRCLAAYKNALRFK
jgi:deoxyribodipyrimidine photo-lyase